MIITPNFISKNGAGVEKSTPLYDKLLSERIIYIFNEINDELAASVTAQLLLLDSVSPGKDIQIYINSPGGSVTAGMAIYDVIRILKSDVCTISCGLCASMGAFLLASGTKGKRYALANSEIMLHQVLGTASGQASDVEIAAKNLIKIRDRTTTLLSEFTGMRFEEVEKICDRDYWLTADEALAVGVVDKVL